MISFLVALDEGLEGPDLGRKADAVEVAPHLGEVLRDDALHARLVTVDPQVVERLTRQVHNLEQKPQEFRNLGVIIWDLCISIKPHVTEFIP